MTSNLPQSDDSRELDLWRMHTPSSPNRALDGGSKDQDQDPLIGSPSDYILIAMIVAMMLCMTLCCLCLFCRSSSRLSICGINFELNDRRNSLDNPENQSEIHEVVPLTPTTAGDYNNRLPDIEAMLKGDAPPMYNEIVKKSEEASKDQQGGKGCDGKSKSFRRKRHSERASETSSTKSNGGRSSWRISGRGILASFRAKSSMLRSRKSDSTLQCPTVEEGVAARVDGLPTVTEMTSQSRETKRDEVTVETINEVTKETSLGEEKDKKMFVYDANELSPDDDDVFL